MFANILCAVDGSDHALKAAKAASELAAKLGAKLTFLTVSKEIKMSDELKHYMEIEHLSGQPQYVLDDYTEQVLDQAQDAARDAGVKNVKTEVLVGQPARSIVRYAERIKADAIVLGGRGQGDLEALLLGSVSYKVNNLATCTCITVK